MVSDFDEVFSEGMTAEERLYNAIFGKPIPEWEGYAIPRIEKFRRFQKASEVFNRLFQNSSTVNKFFYKPEPFQDACGGSVRIYPEGDCESLAVFENREALSELSELIKLVDELEVSAEEMLDGNTSIEISWYIKDPFEGKPES